jgi:hypothetical protein
VRTAPTRQYHRRDRFPVSIIEHPVEVRTVTVEMDDNQANYLGQSVSEMDPSASSRGACPWEKYSEPAHARSDWVAQVEGPHDHDAIPAPLAIVMAASVPGSHREVAGKSFEYAQR